MKVYRVQKGDDWFKLASRFLGDREKYQQLLAVNPGPLNLRPGQRILVPDDQPAPKPAGPTDVLGVIDA